MSETELREALREWWALWDNDGPGSGTHRDGPLNSIPGDVRERHDRILAIEAEARVAGAAEVAGLDAAVAAIKAARARWLEKPRTPVIEGVDIGIELALSLLLIERDRARWDAEIGRLTGGIVSETELREPTTAAGDALLTDVIQDHEAPSYHVIERIRRGILAIEAEARALASIPAEPEQADEVAGLGLSDEQAAILRKHLASRQQTVSEFFGDVLMDMGLGRVAGRDYPRATRFAPARDDTSAWLIERGQPERQVPTVWWTGSSWSSDANKAMRFPDRDAAAAYNEEHSPIPARRDRFGRVTEHRWLPDTSGGAS